ncbi:MAG TPA: hypothetical protein VMP68_02290 [Candidatus Eisenbacteria bacterium]|nr:hypothetical protein [Candidatus Eisenbacteria bacterium]
MPFESQQQIAHNLHESTNTIRRVLDDLLPTSSANPPKVATPQQMSNLLSHLMYAGQRLRALPAQRDGSLEQEICEYRHEVERLRSLLPAIQASLLAERARLEHERERLNGAAAWAQASLQTLAK